MVKLHPTRQSQAQNRVILSGVRQRAVEGSAVRRVPHLRRAAAKVGLQESQRGFTLIELMIVMVIIGMLAAIAVPMYVQSVRHAREAVLKEDLRTMRSAIDSYTVDKQKAPQSLDDIVQAGYLKAMPVDPFTHRTDTWVPSQDDTLQSLDQTEPGITDVHSGAQGVAGDGSSYSTW
jgi:general secretion pathway protein G